MRLIRLLSVCLPAVLLVHCGKDDLPKGTSGQAKMTMSQAESATLNSEGPAVKTYAPSYYGVKMIGVCIAQEKDTTTAPCSQIYVNPGCTPDELLSEVNGKMYSYVGLRECDPDSVTDYFDLARTATEVNKDLNSQNLPVLPGSYKYAMVSFCSGAKDIAKKSLRFKAPGMTENYDAQAPVCGATSTEMDPPLVIAEGESVVVNLEYDLSAAISAPGGGYDESYCYISADKSVIRCAGFPSFVPSAKAAE